MSFDGDLEHLPIVDVIQLLHATGKSGTLTLRALKGESQLVFHNGYIVSANHVNNSVRIGQILMDMGLINEDELTNALREQRAAGAKRKPIVQTMIESGKIDADDAYQGLEVLIEMTIVEVLSWTKGTFSLDVESIVVSDEYRYFPEELKKDIQLNTQSVLMDALRIYDERKRDGKAETIFAAPPEVESGVEISVEDLGLDELDHIERKIPQVFSGLSEVEPDTPATRMQRLLAGIPADEQQRLLRYLDGATGRAQAGANGAGVIVLTADRLLRECLATVCGPRFLFGTSDPDGLDPIIDHSLGKGRVPVLILDPGETGSRTAARDGVVNVVQQKRTRYPDLTLVTLACPGDYQLATRALLAGASAVLPRASRDERPDSFVADLVDSLQILERYQKEVPLQAARSLVQRFKEHFEELSRQREPSEVSLVLLQAVSGLFERAVTLVAVRSDLVAERGIGIGAPGATSSVKLRVTPSDSSLFHQALQGESYYGDADDAVRTGIFGAIGAPASQKVLLLPIKSFGRVIAMIYGDFGSRAGGAPQLELLEMLAQQAGLVIDNALYRKRCAQGQK